MWDKLRAVVTDIGPPTVPIILRRLVRLGLLVKDVASSSKLTAVYGPTEFGYRSLQTEVAATP
jgi:DNA-binding HxlR family transcriptional regulator